MKRPDPIRALRRRNRNAVPKGVPAINGPDRPLRSLECVELELPEELRQAQRLGALEGNLRLFRLGECQVLLAHDPESGWHLSISHPRRLPLYHEWTEARYRLVPDEATMAMILPPATSS
jgi:hypothetical protein